MSQPEMDHASTFFSRANVHDLYLFHESVKACYFVNISVQGNVYILRTSAGFMRWGTGFATPPPVTRLHRAAHRDITLQSPPNACQALIAPQNLITATRQNLIAPHYQSRGSPGHRSQGVGSSR